MVRATATVVLTTLAILAFPTGAHAAPVGPGLAVVASDSVYAVGEPVSLEVTVTNRSGGDCQLAGSPIGALAVVGASRDGAALSPTFEVARVGAGARESVQRLAESVPAGRSLTFEVSSVANGSIETSAPMPDGSALVALWPVAEVGHYEFRLSYAVPPAAGDPRCVGASDVVVVEFVVGDGVAGGSRLPAMVVVAAVVLVLLLLVGWLWRRRRRRRQSQSQSRAAVASGIVLVVTMGVVVAGERPAQATIDLLTGGEQIRGIYAECVQKITKFDPALVTGLVGSKKATTIIPGYDSESREREDGSGTVIRWDPFPHGVFHDGVRYDPCAGLYHEFQHARDNNEGLSSGALCGDTELLIDEVRATFAENRYRVAQGLAPRITYDKTKLPKSIDDCFKRVPRPPRKADNGDPICRGVNGCASSSGDPHLLTFDGAFYDFQAVGEFDAVVSSVDDLLIQVRQVPLPGGRVASVNGAVALRASDERLSFVSENGAVTTRVNGALHEFPMGDSALNGGVSVRRFAQSLGDAYGVRLADGTVVWVEQIGTWALSLTVDAAPVRQGTLAGLFGDFDGDWVDDVRVRDGATLGQPASYDGLYPAFADSWRVTDATSLFDYEPGASTATFTDRTFPDRPVAAADMPASASAAARAACSQLGLVASVLLDACVLDLVLTGDPAFARSALDVGSAAGAVLQRTAAAAAELPAGETTEASVDITQPGETATVRFAARAGDRAFVIVDSTNLPNQCGLPLLQAPDGRTLASGCIWGGSGSLDGTVLPVTGEYHILVDPAGDAIGAMAVRVVLSRESTRDIAADGPPVTLTVEQAGAVATAPFIGTAGQKIFVDLPATTLPAQCGVPTLRGPDGLTVALGCVYADGSGYLDGFVLPQSGPYAITIDPAGTDTGTAQVRLITVHDQELAITANGPAVTGTVAQPGGVVRLLVTATAGQTLTIHATDATLPDQCGVIHLRQLDGPVLASDCIIGGTGRLTATVPATGTYAIEVNPADRQTGTVILRLTT